MIGSSIRRMPRPQQVTGMSTQNLRATCLISDLFAPGEVQAILPISPPSWLAAQCRLANQSNWGATRKPGTHFFSNGAVTIKVGGTGSEAYRIAGNPPYCNCKSHRKSLH
jgi:hypothetical protein